MSSTLTLTPVLRERLRESTTPAVELAHWLSDPKAEDAFARLAAKHPERCTPTGTWTPVGGTR